MRFVLALSLLFVSCVAQAQIIEGPIVGAATDTSARVTLHVSAPENVRIEFSTDSSFRSDTTYTSYKTLSSSSYGFATFDLSNLSPSTRYYIRPIVNDTPSPSLRSFRTFPTQLRDTAFTFCFGSCQMQNVRQRRSDVFRRMRADDPLIFFQLGDWAYPDINVSGNFASSDSLLAQTYVKRYEPTHGMDSLLSECAVDYVWDDHDYTGDNGDGTSPNKFRAIAAYKQFFPHYALPNDSNGIWHRLLIGNVEFFIPDLRSTRSPDSEAIVKNGDQYSWNPPPGHSVLRGTHTTGEDQKTWLMNALKNSKARWKVIVSSVPWNPSMKGLIPFAVLEANQKKDPSKLRAFSDYWVGFPEDQDSLIAFTQREGIKNVVFCSGSVHTGMMDDGAHSIFPEIVSANLEIANSNVYGTLEASHVGRSFWNRGGQINDTLNTYGRITVATSPRNQLILDLVNERGEIVATQTITDTTSSAGVFNNGARSFGLTMERENDQSHLISIAVADRSPIRVYLTDERGIILRELLNGPQEPGTIRISLDNIALSSGPHFAVMEVQGRKLVAKFNVVK
jgi:phosphodiesterase/alkaline phosphatase D-like protein